MNKNPVKTHPNDDQEYSQVICDTIPKTQAKCQKEYTSGDHIHLLWEL